MFAALWLPKFRLQAALRWRDWQGPVALVDGKAAKGILDAVNDEAAAFAVSPGITPAQALARCSELKIVPRSTAQESACQMVLCEIAMEFSPRIESTDEGLCTLDLSGAPKGACWQRLAEQIVTRCAEDGFNARVGIAPHPDYAWLAAAQANPVNVVYNGAPFCAALPLDALGPSARFREIIAEWGIRTVGEFLKLPAEAVVERLGAEAAELRLRASGRRKRVLKLMRQPERYAEAFDFDYAIETTEPLMFLLRRFVDSLSARLQSSHRVAKSLRLTLPMEAAPDYIRSFSIPSPTSDAEVWFRVLSTHLESLTLETQPVGVRLEIEPQDPAGRQLNLFESALRDPNKFGETLAQLKALVGENCIGIPQPADSHRPGAFVMQEFEEASGEPQLSRIRGIPLHRNRPAPPIAVKTMDGCPAWIEALGPVAATAGPFTQSGEWWENSAWKIEEWDVELTAGDCLRIARRPGEGWTLEGAYELR